MKPFPNPLLTFIDECGYREVGVTAAAFTVVPLKQKDTYAMVFNVVDGITAMYLLTTSLPDDLADLSSGLVRAIISIMSGHHDADIITNNFAWKCDTHVGGATLNKTKSGFSIVVVMSHDMDNVLYPDYLSALVVPNQRGETESFQNFSELDTSKLVEITGTPIIATPVDKPTYADYAEFAADISDKLLFTNPDIDGEYIEPLDSFQVTAQSVLGLANVIAVHSTRSYSFDNDCLTNVLTEITDNLTAVIESEDVTIVQNHYSNQLFIDHEHFTLPATTTEKSLSGLLVVYGRVWLKDNTFTYAARVCEVPTTT